jgi:hypothetical protein
MKAQAIAKSVACNESSSSASRRSHPPGPASLLGLLFAAANGGHVPGALWPLEAALQRLASGEPEGVVGDAIRGWRADGDAVRSQFPGLRAVVAGLVDEGHLVPEGGVPSGSFRVSSAWLGVNLKLLRELPASQREAIGRAAQVLLAMATISSKRATTTASVS